jgi:hypothetical protein
MSYRNLLVGEIVEEGDEVQAGQLRGQTAEEADTDWVTVPSIWIGEHVEDGEKVRRSV